MITASSPVREPAWSLPRSAIGLWVAESVISTLLLALGVGAFLVFVAADAGGPVPLLRWAAPIALALYAVVAIGVRPRTDEDVPFLPRNAG